MERKSTIMLLALTMLVFVPGIIYAEPMVGSDGSVGTAILLTPEFEVDVSEFSETGEIILDMKFGSTGNLYEGIKWV